jgi:hypothetical protein
MKEHKMKKATKKTVRPIKTKTTPQWMKNMLPISPTMLFRTVILFTTLVVATIAILNNAYESNVWTFLGSMIVYAALTKGQDVR